MDRANTVVISALIQLLLNLAIVAFYYGRLSQKVEVLWMAVFNHLGQNEHEVWNEWSQKKFGSRHKRHER